MVITSSANKVFRHLNSLWSAKGIRQHNQALVCGPKLVHECINGIEGCQLKQLVYPDGRSYSELPAELPALQLSPALFKQLDQLGTDYPLAVVEAPEPKAYDLTTQEPAIVLPLQNPDNLGAALRSAVAFGIKRIVLTKESCQPYLPRAIRSAAGAIFHAKLCSLALPVAELVLPSQRGVALDAGGEEINAFDWPKNPIFCVGAEGPGEASLPAGVVRCRIPMRGPDIDSLNATVALSIALYQWQQSD